MKHFRKTTADKKIIVGKTTFDSIGELKGRKHYVLVEDKKDLHDTETVEYVDNLEWLMNEFKHKREEVFVIGGKSIYEQTYKWADRLYISQFTEIFEGDVFLEEPNFNDFETILYEKREGYTFSIWERR